MKLVHIKTGAEVKLGDAVKTFRGEDAVVTGWQRPHKPASNGRLNTTLGEFFPSVCDCKWIEREDREESC